MTTMIRQSMALRTCITRLVIPTPFRKAKERKRCSMNGGILGRVRMPFGDARYLCDSAVNYTSHGNATATFRFG